MSFFWRVLPAQRLGYGRLEGVVTGEDLLQAADAFYGDPAWVPGFSLFWDNRSITKLAIEPAEVPEILHRASQLPEYLGGAKAVAVISSDLRIMGEHVIQMSGLEGENIRLCESVDNALAWLELPESVLVDFAGD